ASAISGRSRRGLDHLRSLLPVHALAGLRVCASARARAQYEKADARPCVGAVAAAGIPADPVQRCFDGIAVAASSRATASVAGDVDRRSVLCGVGHSAAPSELVLAEPA